MLNWPQSYSLDHTFAVLKPLVFENSSWINSPSALKTYVQGRARVRSKNIFLKDFHNLLNLLNRTSLNTSLSTLERWLKNPLNEVSLDCSVLRQELEAFLDIRFDVSPENPWAETSIKKEEAKKIDLDEIISTVGETLTDDCKKKLLDKQLKKLNWQDSLKLYSEKLEGKNYLESQLIRNALKDEKLDQESLDEKKRELLASIFVPPIDYMEHKLEEGQLYLKFTAPVLIGHHYLSSRSQKIWFNNKGLKFDKIIGSYARWDDATLILLRDYSSKPKRYSRLNKTLSEEGYKFHGPWKTALSPQQRLAYYVIILPRNFPTKDFPLHDWKLNVGKFCFNIEPYRRKQI